MDKPATLDVREIPPRIRHPKIFEAFDGLKTGEAFELVNDHDPKPLFYQFQHERPDQFRWKYKEEGPEVWRVEILKTTNSSEVKTMAAVPMRPVWAASLNPTQEVLLDVRPMIERGEEPFQSIMKNVQDLKTDQALHLVNSFEPVPLYAMLGKRGFEHFAETKDGAWHVYFKKMPEQSTAPATSIEAPIKDDLFDRMAVRTPRVELDVRGLMPPEPMIQIFEALPSIPSGGVLFVYHHREPVLLYDKLKERGYEGITRRLGDSDYRVLVWKKEG